MVESRFFQIAERPEDATHACFTFYVDHTAGIACPDTHERRRQLLV